MLVNLFRRIRRREPVALATVAVALGLTAYKVYVEKTPLTEVVSTEYIEYVILTAGALVARAQVFTKSSVEHALTTTNVNQHADTPYDGEVE